MAATTITPNLFVLVFLFSLSRNALSLYEDQVGRFDWKRSHVGKLKLAYFDSSSHSSKRVYVATQANVVAALNARTGDLTWRHVYEETNGGIDNLLHSANTLVSVSSQGGVVRCWDAANGHLIWESVLAPTQKSDNEGTDGENVAGWSGKGSTFVGRRGSDEFSIAVLANNQLKVFSLRDGSEKFSHQSKEEDLLKELNVYSDKSSIFMVGVYDNSNIIVKKFNLKSKKLQNQRSISAPWIGDVGTQCLFSGETGLVCLDTLSGQLHYINLDSEDGGMFSMSLSMLMIEEITPDIKLQSLNDDKFLWQSRNEFVLQVTKTHHILLKVDSNTFTVVKEFTDHTHLTASSLSTKAVLVAIKQRGKTISFSCLNLDTGADIPDMKQSVTLPDMSGQLDKAVVYLFKKKDSLIGYRMLLTMEDETVLMVQQPGRIMWLRDESLATITAVEMVELPFSPSQSNFESLQEEFGHHQNGDVFGMFLQRIKAQVKQFQGVLASLNASLKLPHHDEEMMGEDIMEEQSSSKDELTRDQFNLRKLIVAVTECGKIFGLDNQNGNVVWRYFIPNLAPFESGSGKFSLLYTQRSTAHFPLPPQCIVVGHTRTGSQSLVYVFNPLTGRAIEPSESQGVILTYPVKQVMLSTFIDEKFSKLLLLLDSDGKVHVLPSNHGGNKIIASKVKTIFMHVTDKDSGLISGYGLEYFQVKKEFVTRLLWTVSIPRDQQIITTFASKHLHEPVHSQGKVLGDRSVLYKYLNPNWFAIGTVAAVAGKPAVGIYLIDAVTGTILFHCRHKNAEGPLHMVQSDNWLVYQLYNSRSRRHEVSVMEMYEGKEERNSTAFSSFDPPPNLLVLRQSYIFPFNTRSLTVTMTVKGITHKHLLFGLQSGYIFALPKNYLDPRRSLIMTKEDQEEGLLPYVPEIPINPQAYVNYNQTVANIRGIHTSQAGLESTSLVLGYGLDLFYTRVTPSRMFDVLKEDFDYMFVGGTLIVLLVISILSCRLASIKMLKQAWH